MASAGPAGRRARTPDAICPHDLLGATPQLLDGGKYRTVVPGGFGHSR
jgi:hypothetical protein